MSDKTNSSTPGNNKDDNSQAAPLDMGATWVPASPEIESSDPNATLVPSDSSSEEIDYGATITGTVVPDEQDDDREDTDDQFGVRESDTRELSDSHTSSSLFEATIVPGALCESGAPDVPGVPDLKSSAPDNTDNSADDPQRTMPGTMLGQQQLDASIDTAATFVAPMAQEPSIDSTGGNNDDFGATIVGAPSNDDSETHTIGNQPGESFGIDRRNNVNQTVPQADHSSSQSGNRTVADSSRSGSGSSQGSQSQTSPGTATGSRVSSQIWTSSANNSLDELISIRTRPVSGVGQLSELEDADFEIVEKLAEGGMGVVYVARQRSLNRELAIKTLKSAAGAFSGTVSKTKSTKAVSRAERQKREMFLSEALVTANLVHPNIIPIHELAETNDGLPYYVMKRVHGIPWNKRVREMSLPENLEVLHKVCDAIAYAHHHGVINRDLKPENIMLGEFGEVLVLDWGLAVPAPHAAQQNFRSPVASFGAGTPAYMSPELWVGPPDAIGECSDIYLLGAILYEIVTGNAPHDFPRSDNKNGKNDVWKLIDDVLRQNVIRDTKESGELIDIAYKAMRTNPNERFGSVLELQFAVRNYQRHEESRRLSERASELMNSQATSPRDYHTCQTAAALFEESLRTWPQNGIARNGLRSTRLIYAKLASSKGDYDLGLQIAAQENDSEFTTLAAQLKSSKRLRAGIKWTALTAMLCVVLLGVKAIRDNGIILNLNEEVVEKKKEADQAIETANNANIEASKALAAASTAKDEAELAQIRAKDANTAADLAKSEAEVAKADAKMSSEQATAAKEEALTAIAKAETAAMKTAMANAQLAVAQKNAESARVEQVRAEEEQAKAETAARIAQVEIQSQSIRGLTLNENYSDALREINRLLDGELLPQLPEAVRERRTVELQAQREQLLKRTQRTDEPVQTQTISADGKLLAQGNAAGRVVVQQNPGESMTWSTEHMAQLELNSSITDLHFVDAQTLLIASGQDLFAWNMTMQEPRKLEGHSAGIRGLDVHQNIAISGDESGLIIVWNLPDFSRRTTLKANTSLRDVVLIPGTRDFIYAGARGGQSADILAYRIPETSGTGNSETPPVRLGQLQMSRQHNHPPLRLSVSPNGDLLVISNGTNGDLFALPRLTASADAANLEFPFAQPADLEQIGDMSWLLRHHSRPVNDMDWSGDGQRFVTASDDRRIGLWSRVENGTNERAVQFERFLRGHGARVTQAEFLDPAGSRISSASTDGFSRLWNLESIDADSRQIRNAFDLSLHWIRTTRQPTASHFRYLHDYQLTTLRTEQDFSAAVDSRATNVETADDSESQVLNQTTALQRGSVRAVQFSDDGKRLVSGTEDGSIVVWDLQSLKPASSPDEISAAQMSERFREGHEFNISQMKQVGPSKEILVTAGFDGSLRLWNLAKASGRQGVQQQVIAGLGLVNSFASSPNGKFLVSSAVEDPAAEPGRSSIWMFDDLLNSPTPEPVGILAGGHRAEVTAISVSADNLQIATGGRDGVISIWEAETFNRLTSLRAHGKNTTVTALEWLSDGTLVSAGLDGKLVQWKIEANAANASGSEKAVSDDGFRLVQVTKFNRDKTPIEKISLSPDQSQVLAISVETDRARKSTAYHLERWQFETPERQQRILLANVAGKKVRAISSVEWSTDASRVLVCADGAVQLLNSENWKVARVLKVGASGASDAQFVLKQNTIEQPDEIITFDGTTATTWNLATGEQIVRFRGPYPINAVAFSRSAETDLVLAVGDSLRIFSGNAADQSFGRPLFHLQRSQLGQLTSISVCPTDANLIMTSSTDGTVTLWRWISADLRAVEVSSPISLKTPITVARWSPNGKTILIATRSGEVRLVSLDGAELAFVRPGQGRPVELLTGEFSPDGRHIVVAGLMSQTSESVGWVFTASASQPQHDATNADQSGELATPTHKDSRASNESGQLVLKCSFSGHEAGGISAAAFSGNSPYLISGGNDGSMIVWNWQNSLPTETPTAYEAYRFLSEGNTTAHQGPVTSLTVSNRGQIASGSQDGQVILWNLSLLAEVP